MRYKSLFESNSAFIDNVFNDPDDLKKRVESLMVNVSSGDREALNHYLQYYIDPAKTYKEHNDASGKNTPEYKIYDSVIRNKGDIVSAKDELQNDIQLGKYKKEFDLAGKAYHKLVSDIKKPSQE